MVFLLILYFVVVVEIYAQTHILSNIQIVASGRAFSPPNGIELIETRSTPSRLRCISGKILRIHCTHTVDVAIVL
jgi:hypothetical protein